MTTDTLLTEAAQFPPRPEPQPDNSNVAGDPNRWPLYSMNDMRTYVVADRQLREREAKAEGLDAARLDAIEEHMWFVEPQYHNDTWRVGKANDEGQATHRGKTLRAAIDAALATKPGDGESR